MSTEPFLSWENFKKTTKKKADVLHKQEFCSKAGSISFLQFYALPESNNEKILRAALDRLKEEQASLQWTYTSRIKIWLAYS